MIFGIIFWSMFGIIVVMSIIYVGMLEIHDAAKLTAKLLIEGMDQGIISEDEIQKYLDDTQWNNIYERFNYGNELLDRVISAK